MLSYSSAPPPALANVTVRPSTVLALLLWEVAEDGGYPVSHFEARYRLKNQREAWHAVTPEHITANVVRFSLKLRCLQESFSVRIHKARHLNFI